LIKVDPPPFNWLVDGHAAALGVPDPPLEDDDPPQAARINVRPSSPKTPR